MRDSARGRTRLISAQNKKFPIATKPDSLSLSLSPDNALTRAEIYAHFAL